MSPGRGGGVSPTDSVAVKACGELPIDSSVGLDDGEECTFEFGDDGDLDIDDI